MYTTICRRKCSGCYYIQMGSFAKMMICLLKFVSLFYSVTVPIEYKFSTIQVANESVWFYLSLQGGHMHLKMDSTGHSCFAMILTQYIQQKSGLNTYWFCANVWCCQESFLDVCKTTDGRYSCCSRIVQLRENIYRGTCSLWLKHRERINKESPTQSTPKLIKFWIRLKLRSAIRCQDPGKSIVEEI